MPPRLLLLAAVAASAALHLFGRAAALADVQLALQPGVYNPSLVVYEGAAWLVARSTQLRWDDTGLKWIVNRAHLCRLNTTDWRPISCHDFDPWRGSFGNQCRWGSAVWRVPWEAWGVDDTKLFVWPGRGLWAMTGRRPHQPPGSIYCPQPVIWKQWLVQLAREGQPLEPQRFEFPASGPPNVTWAPGPKQQGRRRQRRQRRRRRRRQLLARSEEHALAGPAGSRLAGRDRHIGALRQLNGLGGGGSGGSEVLPQHSTLPSWRAPAAGPVSTNAGSFGGGGSGRSALQRRRRRRRQGRQHQGPSTLAGPADGESGSGPSAAAHLAERFGLGAGLARRGYRQHTRPMSAAHAEPLQRLPAAHALAGGNRSPPAPAGSGSEGGWEALWGRPPLPLAIADAKAVYGSGHSLVEKNWMPFVWQGQLLAVYCVAPTHRVYRITPSGVAEPAWESDPGPVVSALGADAATRLHGGPPLVLVDPAALRGGSSNGDGGRAAAPFYLGVVHLWLPATRGANKDGRSYHHYLVRVEVAPPFRVAQLSAELPLRYSEHYKRVAFVSGLDVAVLKGQPRVLLSYGSGDWESRLAVLGLDDVERLFSQGPVAPSAGAPGR